MTELSLRDIFHRIVDIGEQADNLARVQTNHACTMGLRDLAIHIENSIRAISPATLQAIAYR
jgi:hypothetical protein